MFTRFSSDRILDFFITFWFSFVPLFVLLKIGQMAMEHGFGKALEIWFDTLWSLHSFLIASLFIAPGVCAIWFREKRRYKSKAPKDF